MSQILLSVTFPYDIIDTRAELGDYMESIYKSLPLSANLKITQVELRKLLAEYFLAQGEEKLAYFDLILRRASSKLEVKYITRLMQNSLLIGVGDGRINIILAQLLNQEGSEELIKRNARLIERIESEVLGHYLSREIGQLEIGLPYPEMPIREEDDASNLRHKLRRRSNSAIYELDPFGMRVQIHYSKSKDPKLMMFQNNQDIRAESFGLDEKMLRLLEDSKVQECVLDAKITAYQDSSSKFYPFEEYMYGQIKGEELGVKPVLHISDLLRIDGTTMTGSPILERKKVLGKVFEEANEDSIKVSQFKKVKFGM